MSNARASQPGQIRGFDVPPVRLDLEWEQLGEEISSAVQQVLESRRYVLGPEVEELESDVCSELGVEHAVAVASGSDALLLALMAIHLQPGEVVISTPFSFVASVGCVLRLGGVPAFVDIDPATFVIEPDALRAWLEKETTREGEHLIWNRTGSRIRAMIPVHLYGLPADTEQLSACLAGTNVVMIEDVAQAYGAMLRSQAVGTFGEFGCLSFYPTKNLGAYGDAGMLLTNNPKREEQIRILRNHGQGAQYQFDQVGINSRLDTVQAAILGVKRKYLKEWNESRRAMATKYDELIGQSSVADRVATPVTPEDRVHVYHQYTIRVPERDTVLQSLRDEGIGAGVYYPSALNRLNFIPEIAQVDCPVAEHTATECLSLPIWPGCESDCDRVVEVLEAAVEKS